MVAMATFSNDGNNELLMWTNLLSSTFRPYLVAEIFHALAGFMPFELYHSKKAYQRRSGPLAMCGSSPQVLTCSLGHGQANYVVNFIQFGQILQFYRELDLPTKIPITGRVE